MVPQGTLPPRGPSLAYRRFTLSSRGPSLACRRFTLSSRGPSLACRRFTLSCYAIHLVNTSLYARRPRPSAIAPASPQGPTFGALPSPIPGLVRPTVPQAYVDQLLYSLVKVLPVTVRIGVQGVEQLVRRHCFLRVDPADLDKATAKAGALPPVKS